MVVAVLLLATLSDAMAGEPIDPSPVLGTFVGDEEAAVVQARLDAAIEQSVSQMGLMVRGRARSALTDKVQWCAMWTLRTSESNLVVECTDRGASQTVPLDSGQSTMTGRDGQSVDVLATDGPDQLTVRNQTSKMTSTRTFRVLDSEHIEVRTEMSSERLPRAITHTVRYRRVEDDT